MFSRARIGALGNDVVESCCGIIVPLTSVCLHFKKSAAFLQNIVLPVSIGFANSALESFLFAVVCVSADVLKGSCFDNTVTVLSRVAHWKPTGARLQSESCVETWKAFEHCLPYQFLLVVCRTERTKLG